MPTLKERLYEKIQEFRPRIHKLLKEHGDVVIDEVSIRKALGGMRDIKALVTDISSLDPEEGIRFRGLSIPEVFDKLLKIPGAEMPSVEAFFYLLMTGEIPDKEETEQISHEFNKRKHVPWYVFEVLRALPKDTHPMTMFANAIAALQRESKFAMKYREGHLKKEDYWDPTYEDTLNLLAKLPEIAAYIYRMKYKNNEFIPPDPHLDFGGNFAHMMGIDKPYDDVARMYFILHSDHESGNVSAHTGHLIASALSDIYYSIAGMLFGLAGPLHGLANQEVLRWIQDKISKHGGLPDKSTLKKDIWDTLNAGQVIPGFGHAVLRKTDPRYTAQREFCLKHIQNDPLIDFVQLLYETVPSILKEQGKAKNPWPNVDAHSGVLQWHYGIKEYDFYTVLFGVGRAIGVCSNIIWDRALMYPLERPKSVTTCMLEEMVRKSGKYC